jgi:hypothetical protein
VVALGDVREDAIAEEAQTLVVALGDGLEERARADASHRRGKPFLHSLSSFANCLMPHLLETKFATHNV